MIIDYMKVGERVREKRKTAGRTQARLAEAVDLSTEYICEIETGRKNARRIHSGYTKNGGRT